MKYENAFIATNGAINTTYFKGKTTIFESRCFLGPYGFCWAVPQVEHIVPTLTSKLAEDKSCDLLVTFIDLLCCHNNVKSVAERKRLPVSRTVVTESWLSLARLKN